MSSLAPASRKSRRKGGDMAGPYVLGKTLGRGTSGKVKAAYHKDTGMEVAVKIIKKDYVRTHKNKIAREVAVMRLLVHPRIMKLYDVFETRMHYFIVLERIKGGELFDYIIQKGRLPRKEALRILSQCIQGLEFCHMHSICHRDLKPENLLLDENLNIKIADFGMAQIIPDGGVLGTFCGSPHYGAPEVVSGIKYDGRKSDVWSLGVVFYALVTGMLPFDHKNIPDLLRLVKRGTYTIPKWVDADIKDLIRRMLCVDVDARIKTPRLKYHPVFQGKNGVNLYFPAHPPSSPALEYMKKHPIKTEDDIDDSLLSDLEGLGWGKKAELKHALLKQRDESLHNIEAVFYYLLAARDDMGLKKPKQAPKEPLTPPPVSFAKEPSSPTPEAIRDSHRHHHHHHHHKDEQKKPAAAPAATKPATSGSGKKKHPTLTIDTVKPAAGTDDAMPTTPRFHRLKMTDEDSANSAPVTPTPKKSWFRSLFKRRPSVDIVSKEHQQQGASGLYSEYKPDEIRKEVERVLHKMGVHTKIPSNTDYELKCNAVCYLDDQHRLCVMDKSGAELVYRDDGKDEHDDVPVPAPPSKPVEPLTPTSPSGAGHSPNKPHTIKFTIDISREQNDKVSCINFNHRSGHLVVYRSLYTDIIKHLVI